jgi:alkylation response protein AidB-like acyl-CoA dehydrogenase
MNFTLPDELRMLRETVARFVREELIPLEPMVIERESRKGLTDEPALPPDVEAQLHAKAKAIGLWGIDVPERYGGQDLGALAKCVVLEQMKYSIVPLVLRPDSPNLFMLERACRREQIQKYLLPYSKGDKTSCIAITEPGAGSDVSGISTRAERRNGKWILNGSKVFISNARSADFMIVIAVSDPAKGKRGGMTAFLVDQGTAGVSIPSSFPTLSGEYHPYAVYFDNVELSDEQVLGEVGQAFIPLQNRLGVRRMEIAARSLGFARRCIDLMIRYANERTTFGVHLADRQAIQWFIADSYQELEMARLLTYRIAWRLDEGATDFRREASMAKVQATEMIQRVVDRAMQMHGGLGMTKALPLEYISRVCRVYRIVEGPSEVHRWTIARDLLKNGFPNEW